MSIILKSDSFTVPESSALNMRGLQTDSYNQVLGGHKSIFDPVQSGVTGTLATGTAVAGLVFNQPELVVTSRLTSETIESAKGFPFADTGGGVEFLTLPKSTFNLLQLGSEPSVVISAWITNRNLTATVQGIAGCSFQTSGNAQWYISTGSVAGSIRMGAQAQNVQFTGNLDVPELYSFYFKRTSAGNMLIELKRDTTTIGTLLSTYPFINPELGAGGAINGNPTVGYIAGFGTQWNGIVHRIQCFKVDPATFDFNSWLVDEIAGNAGRFDL